MLVAHATNAPGVRAGDRSAFAAAGAAHRHAGAAHRIRHPKNAGDPRLGGFAHSP